MEQAIEHKMEAEESYNDGWRLLGITVRLRYSKIVYLFNVLKPYGIHIAKIIAYVLFYLFLV